MDDEGLTPKKLERLINSAVNPTAAYRKEICRRLARQTYNQFGMEGLFDLLTGIDDIGRMSSVVVAERSEIENFVFQRYGIFDPDIFEKVVLSASWEDFMGDVMDWSSQRVSDIIEEVVEGEQA